MKSYLIILQLGFSELSYSRLISYIKTANSWAHPMPFIWVIKTSVDIASVRDGVKSRINVSDRAFLVEVSNSMWATSNISKSVTDWMKNNL